MIDLDKYATDRKNLAGEIDRLRACAGQFDAMSSNPRLVTLAANFRVEIAIAITGLESAIGNVKRWAAEVPAGPLEDLQAASEPVDPRAEDLVRAFRRC